MIELIKEASTILKDLPDLAIWILIGILFYKTIIVGSIFGIIKLAINKLHSGLTNPREVKNIIEYKIGDDFVNEETYRNFLELIKDIRYYKSKKKKDTHLGSYIFSSDIKFFKNAIQEQYIKEQKDD